MWWLGRKKPREVWEEEIQWPIGDIEAAQKVRNICRSAADSAERVGALVGQPASRRKRKNRKAEARDSTRYQNAARTAMEIAMKIADDLMRDSAVGQIVDLCVKADDMKTARILFRAIQAVSIRENVLNDHPALRE
jgi:DNA-binding ferritin-like protein